MFRSLLSLAVLASLSAASAAVDGDLVQENTLANPILTFNCANMPEVCTNMCYGMIAGDILFHMAIY